MRWKGRRVSENVEDARGGGAKAGGIISHAVASLHHLTEEAVDHIEHIPNVGHIIGAITPTLINMLIGIVAGLMVVLIMKMIQSLRAKSKSA